MREKKKTVINGERECLSIESDCPTKLKEQEADISENLGSHILT